MSASIQDHHIAALAAGFTIGFGFLTVWEAIKQTRRNRNPLRSVYIYMVWGEIVANLGLGIMAWLFLNGKLGPTIPVFFAILFFWVFEIQLLMQIIINRIALIAENRSTVRQLKWGTVFVITSINIAVFVIFIPSHTIPPVSSTFVKVNRVWDRTSKVLILIVDAGLNWFFLRTVKIRLVKHHGLTKYAPLVGFNAKLMIVSIGMDALLIGLMFLKNQVVFIQFHPVVYMVKLNIEMSMASLVVRLAQGKPQNDMVLEDFSSSTVATSHNRSGHKHSSHAKPNIVKSIPLSSRNKKRNSVMRSGKFGIDSDEDLGGIECRTDLDVTVAKLEEGAESERSSGDGGVGFGRFGDEMPLRKNGVMVIEKEV